MYPRLLEQDIPEQERFTEDDYDDILDEQGPIEIGNLSYPPSYALRQVDPIAYNEGFNDLQEYYYECPTCSREHDTYEEANECCPLFYCSNCGKEYSDEDLAESCCQTSTT